MRKNGVNKELLAIDGGVCAPSGFCANGVRCGFLPDTDREDLALIFADKRAPVACVFSTGGVCGATATVTKKNIASGYARAIIANSGTANITEGGIPLAKQVCLEVAKRTKALESEVVIASTGKIGKPLSLNTFTKEIDCLIQGLASTDEGSKAAARAIMTEDKTPKQIAYAFDLGAFPCKIGAIFKGGARVSPNMATTLCFMTTDVNISPKMLQKALNTAVRDSFNMLDIDGISSPNDTVCILASGNAGNCRIDYEDTEYKKFSDALCEATKRICVLLAKDAKDMQKLLVCKVRGAKSKRTARAVARAIVCADGVRRTIKEKRLDLDGILGAAYGTGEELEWQNLSISIVSNRGSLVLYEDGFAAAFYNEAVERVLGAEEIEISVSLGGDNFAAQAIGIVRA